MTYSSLSKRFSKHSYFCGWYFRCQSDKQTLAIIPSVHKTKDSAFCTIQVITDTHAFHVQFPFDDLGEDDDQIRISNNRFGKSGFSLDIHTPEFHVAGSVHFGAFTPIKYDIMGPFQYIPFMQCRHSVYSMHHRVDGEIQVNGVPYVFENAVGYVEGDRGCSFPKEYAWTQCSFPDGALMLSVADGIFYVDPFYTSVFGSELPETCQNLPELEVTFTVRCCLTHYWLEGDVLRWTNGERIDYPVSFTLENINN